MSAVIRRTSSLAFLLPVGLLLALGSSSGAQKSPAVPDDVIFESGIEHTNPDNQHLQLNMSRPEQGDAPFPAVICIPGGGFRAGKRGGYDALCSLPAHSAYVAFPIRYRLSPRNPLPPPAPLY